MLAIAVPVVGFAWAFLIYELNVRDSRKRDIESALSLLIGVKRSMVEGWGYAYFANVWQGSVLDERIDQDYQAFKEGNRLLQVNPVPIEPLAALATASMSRDLLSDDTVKSASLALFQVEFFNSLVDLQRAFHGLHAAETCNDDLPADRRSSLAKAARMISRLIHAEGIGAASSCGHWYDSLCRAVNGNIDALEASLTKPFWKVRSAVALLLSSLALLVASIIYELFW